MAYEKKRKMSKTTLEAALPKIDCLQATKNPKKKGPK
jgi:hypothetical protein